MDTPHRLLLSLFWWTRYHLKENGKGNLFLLYQFVCSVYSLLPIAQDRLDEYGWMTHFIVDVVDVIVTDPQE